VFNILSLPDMFHRRTFGIKDTDGVYPALAAGEPVEVKYDSVTADDLINVLADKAMPTGIPWLVFSDVGGTNSARNRRWDTEATGKATVVRGAGLEFETDLFTGDIEGLVYGAPLVPVGSDEDGTLWRLAVAGELSFATVDRAPLADAADGGILKAVLLVVPVEVHA